MCYNITLSTPIPYSLLRYIKMMISKYNVSTIFLLNGRRLDMDYDRANGDGLAVIDFFKFCFYI